MPFFDGASGGVFFRRWRVRSGPTTAGVVLLHGWAQHSGDYHDFAGMLTRRSIGVWGIDHVGHGMSEGRLGVTGPLSDLVDNARGLARIAGGELPPGAPVLVVGHSLGAVVAAALASPAPRREQDSREPDVCSAVVLSGVPFGGAHGPGRNAPRPVRATPDEYDAGDAAARGHATERVRRRFARGSRVPVLVLHGADDRIAPVEGVRSEFEGRADVRLVVYEGAGHDLPHEPVRADVAARIARFAADAGRPVHGGPKPRGPVV